MSGKGQEETMSTIAIVDEKKRGRTTRVLWWFFIGWWASFGWLSVAWLLIATLLGLPLGMEMLGRFPDVVSLGGRASLTPVRATGVGALAQGGPNRQRNVLRRLAYFILVGWWLSMVWVTAAWFCGGAYWYGLPFALRILDKTPKMAWRID
jgi:uncharacterized membrane protein YccF (DUF307 family)